MINGERSPKAYIDTSHLVNMARLRKGSLRLAPDVVDAYQKFDLLIREQHVGVIFNQASTLDWVDGGATEQSVRELARVIQSARVHYYFPDDSSVYLAEILRECRRIAPDLGLPELSILEQILPGQPVRIPLGYLAKRVPGYLGTEVLEGDADRINMLPDTLVLPTFESFALETLSFRHRQREIYDERVRGFRAAMAEDISNPILVGSNRHHLIANWIKHFLHADRVIAAFAPRADVDQILNALDLNRCPAVQLFCEAWYKRIRAGHQPSDNDADDWVSLPLAIYADLMVTEKPLREFIIQADRRLAAKVVSDIRKANATLQQLIT